MIKNIISLVVISFSLILTSCASSKKTVYKSAPTQKRVTKSKRSTSTNTRSNNPPTIADKVVWTAVSFKGTPYKYAGVTKKGMDCSGLIYTSFKERDIILPRSSSLQYQEGRKIALREAKRGDLLFFKTTNKTRSKVNHVGLVTSVVNGVVKFIHASSSRGVVVNSMNESYYKKAFIEAKRIL